jgi:trk system potassium uptake protein TrkH
VISADKVADRPAGAEASAGSVLGWLVGGYLALVFAGFLIFKLGPVTATGHEMSGIRAAFMAVNAATLTGFQGTVGLEDLDEQGILGPATVLALTLGGALFSMIAGGLAAVRVLRLPYTGRQVVSAAFASLLIAVLAGATPLLSPDRRMFDSLFLATSAFTNSGLYVGRLPGISSVLPHAVLLPLSFAGGLGLPVLMELFDRVTGGAPRVSNHSRTVLWTSAVLYLGATAAFLLLLSPRRLPESAAGAAAWREALAASSALAINGRSLGLPFEFAGAYPRTVQWLLMLLMAIGANPAGTGGGLKATTVVALSRGARASLAGRTAGRPFGIAATWLVLYAGTVFAGLLLLLWRVPDVSADRLLFLSVSAASNVGLSHDPVSTAGAGLYTLCVLMLAGRIVPVIVLWKLATTAPEAEIAVG